MADVQTLVPLYGALAERAALLPNGARDVSDENLENGENKVWYLRQNRLFAQAADASIESCEHIFKTTLFPKRSLVFDQGDPTRLVYLVKRGRVRIARLTADGKEITLAVLGPGDLFGEETLFDQPIRTTVALCLDEVLLCTAKADDLFALLSLNPQLALNVAKILSERLDGASATMEDLAYARVPERLMHLFVRLANEHGVRTEQGVVVELGLTHADLASLIGSTRETVTLEMSNLVRAGRIKNESGRITLPVNEMERL